MATVTEEKPLSLEQERAAGAEPEAPSKPRPVYFKEAVSSVQGFKNFLRYKVSADQLYGTIFLLVVMYSNMQGFIGAWTRQGKKDGATDTTKVESLTNKKNWQSVISSSLTLGVNVWSLLSSRGAVPPDGNSYKERIMDVMQHPERSQEHFKFWFFQITAVFSEWSNIKYGFTKAGMPEEKFSKRLQSIILPVSMFLNFIDLYEDKAKRRESNTTKETGHHVAFAASQSKIMQSKWLYPVRVLRETWRNNPKRIISILLNFIFPIIQLYEGVSKRHSMQERYKEAFQIGSNTWIAHKQKLETANGKADKEDIISSIKKQERESFIESRSLIKKSVVRLIMSVANSFYSLDQLYKGEKMKEGQETSPAHQNAERSRKPVSGGVSR